MAQAKKVQKKATKKVETNDELVINLDTIIISVVVIVAALIISLSIFLTNKGGSSNAGNTGTEAGTPSVDEEEFPEATTVIGNSPYLGDKKKAKVALVEYTDLQCSYCSRHATETKPSIISDYVDTGKIIYVVRNFPLDFHGEIAVQSANAALCVNELAGREKYFEFYAQAFLKASTDELATIAQGLGVDMNKYNVCMSENRYNDQIDQEMAEGTEAGVMGTPGFVIGVLDEDGNVTGRLIAGAYPYEAFKSLIDEMLE